MGDFFKDPIPKGHDAILVANIIHCFPTDQALDFSTALVFAALMAAEFLLTPGRGDVYSIDDVPRRDMGFWCEQSRLM
jgi:hypothetical protein